MHQVVLNVLYILRRNGRKREKMQGSEETLKHQRGKKNENNA